MCSFNNAGEIQNHKTESSQIVPSMQVSSVDSLMYHLYADSASKGCSQGHQSLVISTNVFDVNDLQISLV